MSKTKARARKKATPRAPTKVDPRKAAAPKSEPVVTDEDRLKFAQKLSRDRQMVIDELMQMNAEQTLIIARQRAALKLHASGQQAGG